MTSQQLSSLREKFFTYVDSFQKSDNEYNKHIRLKVEHSEKVSRIALAIAQDENMNEADCYLAEALGYLHDIGRFEQYDRYRTFSDKDSVDHAELGVEILAQENFLENLEQPEQEIINKAIAYHNKIRIPPDENGQVARFSKLIRDADKLDIFRVVMGYINDPDINKSRTVVLDLNDDADISDSIYRAIMNNELASYKDLKSANDFRVLQASWIYDVNFAYTLQQIKAKDYIKLLFEQLPESQRINNIRQKLLADLDQLPLNPKH